jgi:hypothetical protein
MMNCIDGASIEAVSSEGILIASKVQEHDAALRTEARQTCDSPMETAAGFKRL